MSQVNAHSTDRVAYHEAGHAVIAIANGLKFSSVTIVPTDEYAGCLLGCKWPRGMRQVLEWDAPTVNMRDKIEKRIAVVLAGPVAESHACGEELHDSEYCKACDILMRMCGSDSETEAYLSLLHIRTQQQVKAPQEWPMIEALAKQLQEHKTLTYDEACQCYSETRQRLFEDHCKGHSIFGNLQAGQDGCNCNGSTETPQQT